MRAINLLVLVLAVVAIAPQHTEAFGSANIKSGLQKAIGKMGFDMSSIKKKLEKSVPQIPSLSSDAQASLAKQSEQLKQLEQAGNQDIPVPTGLDEEQANQMTQTKEAAKSANKQLQNMAIPAMSALTEEQEKSMATAQTDLKQIQSQMSSPLAPPVPTVPNEITNSLAAMAVDEKYFKNNPTTTIQKPAAASKLASKASNSLMQAATIYKPTFKATPVRSAVNVNSRLKQLNKRAAKAAPSDNTGAGGEEYVAASDNTANREIIEALNRANKHISRLAKNSASQAAAQVQAPVYLPPQPTYYPQPTYVPTPVYMPAPQQQTQAPQTSPTAEKEIEKLRKQMKTLTSTLATLTSPSAEQKKKVDQQVQTNQKIQQLENQLKVTATPAPKAASPAAADITAAKVKIISELVSNLDELGRAFGEDDMAEEDEVLAEKEDQTASLLRSDLAAGVDRVSHSLLQHPAPFKEHTHLRHIGSSVGYPGSVNAQTTTDGMDSLEYLKALKQHVLEMKQQSALKNKL